VIDYALARVTVDMPGAGIIWCLSKLETLESRRVYPHSRLACDWRDKTTDWHPKPALQQGLGSKINPYIKEILIHPRVYLIVSREKLI
jgi:hypothetical protein